MGTGIKISWIRRCCELLVDPSIFLDQLFLPLVQADHFLLKLFMSSFILDNLIVERGRDMNGI